MGVDEQPDDQTPVILDLPVGIAATGDRAESDSLGEVLVPADHYWGAQTQRSLQHFDIGDDKMPKEVHRAYGVIKQAAAIVNTRAGRLPQWKGELIVRVGQEIASGELDSEFPLHVWQTGSGTHTNMNVNEVIANRCNQLLGAELGSHRPIHPNDDVNMSQSSNDTFPTAMHLASYKITTEQTIPALRRLRDAIDAKARQWESVVKIGRTHLQDATPLTVGQEWSGYVGALDDSIENLEYATSGLLHVALGGTAVGTGINAPANFDEDVAAELARLTGFAIVTADNKFTAQATLDRMVRAHGALASVAVTLYKIANDLRWLGSGPRTGLAELVLPSNEAGSSIMPGKVNPTQAEALLMVCIEVMGSDVSVQMAGAEGNFELNAFRPIVIRKYLHSALLIEHATDRFREFMIEGTALNESKISDDVARSVMLVTALSPIIGYDQAARIAHDAIERDVTLKEAALANGVSEALFDEVVVPIDMTHPGPADES